MQPALYLYVSDQGGVFNSEDEPTAEDLEFAGVGMRTIVRLDELHYYGGSGDGCRFRRDD